MVAGIHLEGPFISELRRLPGAHPLDAVRDPDWDVFQELQEASGGRIVLMTLAPERPGSIEFIRQAAAAGVVVALGPHGGRRRRRSARPSTPAPG